MTTKTNTPVEQIKINRLNQTQFDNATTIENNELYAVDPQFTGGKVLATDSNGDIVESNLLANDVFSRNIGEIVQSTMPLTDAGLHLLDGSLLQYGSYKAFIDYIAELYADQPIIDVPFVQPVLSADGTMGGDSFAVAISDYSSLGGSAYYAFDGTTSTKVYTYASSAVGCSFNLVMYNPKSLKVSKLSITNNADSPCLPVVNYAVYGSNDNSTWTELVTGTNTNTTVAGTWNINITTDNYYKYIKFACLSGSPHSSGYYAQVSEVKISATYKDSAIFCTEENWQTAVTTYGVCGKFVYDSVNNTVRLPKYNSKIYTGGGNAPVKGNGKTLGLTDGTNNTGLTGWVNSPYAASVVGSSSAFNGTVGTNYGNTAAVAMGIGMGVTTDGTKSGIIADLANITTSVDGYYYIVLATTTKTNIEVDIDEVATDLNGKADIDLSNITPTQTVKNTIINWGMPDWAKAIDISSSFPYTCPSDGYLFINNWNGYVEVGSDVCTAPGDYVASGTSNARNTGMFPVVKNEKLTLSATYNNWETYFVPMKGV